MTARKGLVFLLVILKLFCVLVSSADGPVADTKQGMLKGVLWETKKGRKFNAFLGIPYAKPPLGNLRFAPPVPGDSWQGVKDATEVHNICPQRDVYRRSTVIEGDEDCLYLNVYTPKVGGEGKESLPVMVFFHGGGWLCGGGYSHWYGPHILLDRDVVLVVINYRLGALGFLSTGDEVCPGNNGLKDQSLALKWVKNNIKGFGGDPSKVTLFGESAGGASAHFHMLSKMSTGLFRSAISQSGTGVNLWAVAPGDEGTRNSKKIATLLNCPSEDTQTMIDCLRKIDAYDFVKQDEKFMVWDYDPMIPFKPVIEPETSNAFLTKHPIDIIKSGKFSQVPWMLGMNSEDGALKASGIMGKPELLKDFNEKTDELMQMSMFYELTSEDPDFINKEVKKFYFANKNIDISSKEALVKLYTDGWFLFSMNEAVELHRNHSNHPIYYYLFGHRPPTSFSSIFGDPHNDYGVCHVDELQYLFPISEHLFPDTPFDEKDNAVVDIMTSLWTNFATYLDPTPEINDLITEKWEPVRSEKMEYYYIDSKHMKMKRELYKDRAEFWRTLPLRSKQREIKTRKDEL